MNLLFSFPELFLLILEGLPLLLQILLVDQQDELPFPYLFFRSSSGERDIHRFKVFDLLLSLANGLLVLGYDLMKKGRKLGL